MGLERDYSARLEEGGKGSGRKGGRGSRSPYTDGGGLQPVPERMTRLPDRGLCSFIFALALTSSRSGQILPPHPLT